MAVQVQHRGLREASAVDLATIDFLVKAAKLLAPDFDYQARCCACCACCCACCCPCCACCACCGCCA